MNKVKEFHSGNMQTISFQFLTWPVRIKQHANIYILYLQVHQSQLYCYFHWEKQQQFTSITLEKFQRNATKLSIQQLQENDWRTTVWHSHQKVQTLEIQVCWCLSLSIKTRLLKCEVIDFCFATETTSNSALTRLAFHSIFLLIFVIDSLLQIWE